MSSYTVLAAAARGHSCCLFTCCRWPQTRWSQWSVRWLATRLRPTTGSWRVHASTARRASRTSRSGQHLPAWHSCVRRLLVLQPHASIYGWTYIGTISRHRAVPHVILVPLQAMACAANYAWVNRSSMTFLCRQAFAKLFKQSPDELDMNVIYDVSHNIAKVCKLCCRRRSYWFAGSKLANDACQRVAPCSTTCVCGAYCSALSSLTRASWSKCHMPVGAVSTRRFGPLRLLPWKSAAALNCARCTGTRVSRSPCTGGGARG